MAVREAGLNVSGYRLAGMNRSSDSPRQVRASDLGGRLRILNALYVPPQSSVGLFGGYGRGAAGVGRE